MQRTEKNQFRSGVFQRIQAVFVAEAKGFIRRDEPGFICTALVSQEEVQKTEAKSLLDKVFGGSRRALFSALLEDEKLSDKEIEELKGSNLRLLHLLHWQADSHH